MKIFRGLILWLIVTVVFYFISVLILLMTVTLSDVEFENIWYSSIPVTIFAELIFFSQLLYQKHKKNRNKKLR